MHNIKIDYLTYISSLKIKSIDNKTYVFDIIRKKYLRLFPEELVRQLCLLYLINEKKFPKSLITVEKSIVFNEQIRRYDILTYTKDYKPFFLVECKSPDVILDQKVLDQISHYNLILKVPYLFITNGKFSFCFVLNKKGQKYLPLLEVPVFKHNPN